MFGILALRERVLPFSEKKKRMVFSGDRLLLGERVCMTSKVTQERSPFQRGGADPSTQQQVIERGEEN